MRTFTLISIRFIHFQINTSISIHITRKLKILPVRILWLLYRNYHIRNCHINKFFVWLFTHNSLKPHNTGMHIGIQNLLSWEQNIYILLHKTYLDKIDKFIFQKGGLKFLFSTYHWAAISRIFKNAAFWWAEKILLIHFHRTNKVNVFVGRFCGT